jgi:Ca2+-binding EF-hand superfamily protein
LLTVGVAGAIDVPGHAQGRDQQRTRFAGMDRNGDRIITRKEWQGSARSFRMHDWNNDGVLSGEEVRPAGRNSRPAEEDPFDSAEREYEFTNWTEEGFRQLDHNRDGRVTREEWHFALEDFRRADHNRDDAITRAEFLNENDAEDDDRGDRFAWLDTNDDGRVSRQEWHGTAERFNALDDNRDGVLTRAEMRGTSEPPPDLFTSVDVNRDGAVTTDEWHWSRGSFTARDANRDGRLSRQEFAGTEALPRQGAYRAGYDRGLTEGRAAGREDRERNQGWDLEGQRELESADSGYETRFGPKQEYQNGYREGFRRGYREGWNQR